MDTAGWIFLAGLKPLLDRASKDGSYFETIFSQYSQKLPNNWNLNNGGIFVGTCLKVTDMPGYIRQIIQSVCLGELKIFFSLIIELI